MNTKDPKLLTVNRNLIADCCRFFLLFIIVASCQRKPSPEAISAFESVIPKPESTHRSEGVFVLTDKTVIVADPVEEVMKTAQYLSDRISKSTGFNIPVVIADGNPPSNSIVLSLNIEVADFGQQGYALNITEDGVALSSVTPAGLFYGVQTLRQLFPVKIESDVRETGPWEIATGTITDQPRFGYRGAMLDVARHFFKVEDVKRYIDLIAYYKMNALHLHLSDDQGWRIEIKSWPALTMRGGSTQVGGGEGGYYTQEQYADIVAYAAQNFITVIPEIDMPGHINAALASYGELNAGIVVPEEGRIKVPITQDILGGKNRPTALYKGIEVGWSTLKYDKPETQKFISDVIREMAQITPGPYLHIGGDEARVTKKEDYIKFINKFQELVRNNGKMMIGWNEIAQAEINTTTIAQFWDSEKYAQMALHKDVQLILSPAKKAYLDMQYDSLTKLGLHWAAYIEVDSAYNWDPSTVIDGISDDQVFGVEAPLWTETVVTMDDIEYMAFPRLAGIAEIGWTPLKTRNWEEYKVRLAKHGRRMNLMGINFYRSPRVDWVK